MAEIIDGKKISQDIKDETRDKVAALKEKGIEASLAVILVGNDPASAVYVRNKKKACEYTGIKSLSYELPEETTEEETTFNGIINFPYSEVKSKRIVNLDYCRDDRVIVGSDGDIYNEYLYHGTIINNNLPSYKIELINYPNGNFGVDIEFA